MGQTVGTSSTREPLRRDAIVGAARRLLTDGGLEAVTLRRVADSLGVTAPALYAHVSDKRDLLQAVAEAEFGALIERFEAIDEPAPIDRIRALSRAYVAYARENPALFRVMFLFPPELSLGAGTGQELPLATKAFTIPAAATEQAIAEGLLAGDPLMAALTAWCCIHGVATVLQLGFAFDSDTEEALIDSAIETMIAGLQAR